MNSSQLFVTVNGVVYRLVSLSYDGTWWNVIKTATGEQAYLADTVVQANK